MVHCAASWSGKKMLFPQQVEQQNQEVSATTLPEQGLVSLLRLNCGRVSDQLHILHVMACLIEIKNQSESSIKVGIA